MVESAQWKQDWSQAEVLFARGASLMYARLWHERVGAEIMALPARAFLSCSRDSGIEYAVQRLYGLGSPLISIWIEDEMPEPAMGKILSEAVATGLGSPLFGKGTSVAQGLQALSDYQRVVGPLTIVIGWVNNCRGIVSKVIAGATPETKLLFVSDAEHPSQAPAGLTRVDSAFLQLDFGEAVSEARGAVADESVADLLSKAHGNFARFKVELFRSIGGGSVAVSSADPWSWSEDVAVDGLLDALVTRGRWADAFDLACAHLPERIEEFVDEAGNYYFSKGAYEYIWSRLSALPPDVKRLEKVAYWLVSTAIVTNRQREQGRHAEQVMRESEAPEVRASTAVAKPSENMLAETHRAVENLRSPATLRAHGFAMAWAGNRSEPIQLFREAMRLAERERADHLVVACGIDIAEVEIRQGNYRSGAEWAQWALAEYGRRGLQEKLRYTSGVATLSFARLLLGEVEIAEDMLSNIEVVEAHIDVPGYEAVVSTLGDLAFIQGRYSEAENLYERSHKKAPLEAHCFTALSLIGVHIATGNHASARGLAKTAYAVSRSSGPYEKALGELLIGMSKAETESAIAEQHLMGALEGLACTTADVHVAQSAVWLAIVRMRMGRRRDAVEALKMGTQGIRELGESGWTLICGGHPLQNEVRKLWSETEYEFAFEFLNSRTARVGYESSELGLRAAEIVAILAIHADGLSGERLHAYLYGDASFSRSTMKANISRLRETVPIGSNPYRIDATYQVDFVRVLELLSTGELQQALNLYKGPLLPDSESPLVEEWRAHIDEAVRMAVLESRDADHLIQLGTLLNDDLEIWEFARNCVPLNDYRRPVINARIRRIKAAWAQDALP